MNCWEFMICAKEIKENCQAYIEKKGNICWKITGTKCDSGKFEAANLKDKLNHCHSCHFFQEFAKKY